MAYQQQSQSRYGPCDSYFVETHEESIDGVFARRAEERERRRAIARMQQRALAEELSRTTSDEYQEDIMDHMEYMEVSRLRASNTLPQAYKVSVPNSS